MASRKKRQKERERKRERVSLEKEEDPGKEKKGEERRGEKSGTRLTLSGHALTDLLPAASYFSPPPNNAIKL
jgi:hypothetical protein